MNTKNHVENSSNYSINNEKILKIIIFLIKILI